MPVDDRELRRLLQLRLAADGVALVRMMVETHRQSPDCRRMQLAYWLNARQDPWTDGVQLLEILPESLALDEPDFRATEFAPNKGWPRLFLTWANLEDFGKAQGVRFKEELGNKLASGEALLVFQNADDVQAGTFADSVAHGIHSPA